MKLLRLLSVQDLFHRLYRTREVVPLADEGGGAPRRLVKTLMLWGRVRKGLRGRGEGTELLETFNQVGGTMREEACWCCC